MKPEKPDHPKKIKQWKNGMLCWAFECVNNIHGKKRVDAEICVLLSQDDLEQITPWLADAKAWMEGGE